MSFIKTLFFFFLLFLIDFSFFIYLFSLFFFKKKSFLVHVLSSFFVQGYFCPFSAAADKPYIPGINSIKCTVARQREQSEISQVKKAAALLQTPFYSLSPTFWIKHQKS